MGLSRVRLLTESEAAAPILLGLLMDGTEQQHADVSLGRPLSGPNRLRTPRNSIDFIAFNQAQGIGGGREDSGGRSPGLQPSNGGMARHTVMQRQHARPQQGHGRGTDYQVAVNLPNGDKAKVGSDPNGPVHQHFLRFVLYLCCGRYSACLPLQWNQVSLTVSL